MPISSTSERGDFIGTSQLARLLERSEATVRAAEREGRLPKAQRAGNRRFWAREEILAFIQQKEQGEESR